MVGYWVGIMTNRRERRSKAGFVWVAVVCLLLLLAVMVHGPGSHGLDCAPYLLVPVFLFAMLTVGERVWVDFEDLGLPRWVSRSCLFQRPPPAAFL